MSTENMEPEMDGKADQGGLPGREGRKSSRREATAPEGVLLLTRKQMAKALQVSEKTLDRMVMEGRIRCLRLGDCAVRFNVARELQRLEETEGKAGDAGAEKGGK